MYADSCMPPPSGNYVEGVHAKKPLILHDLLELEIYNPNEICVNYELIRHNLFNPYNFNVSKCVIYIV